MDTTIIQGLVEHFVKEAFKQSPHNGSDGFSFAMGTLATLCVLLLGGFGILYRDSRRDRRAEKAERKQARIEAATQIDGQFKELRREINSAIDEIEKETHDDIGTLKGQYAVIREELAGLKVEIRHLMNTRR